MVPLPRGPADTTAQEVVRRLRATGSSDLDVLYAARQELSGPFDRQRMICLWIIVAGSVVCCTVVLAPIGIPTVLFGVRHRRRSAVNLAVIESAHAAYIDALAPGTQPLPARGACA